MAVSLRVVYNTVCVAGMVSAIVCSSLSSDPGSFVAPGVLLFLEIILFLSQMAVYTASLLSYTGKMRLRPYQLEDSEWARETGRCLLAHEQGVGKTVIAAMALPTESKYFPILIVCPAAVIHHWETSLNDWRPDLSVGDERKDNARVISYDLLRSRRIRRPKTLVVDECHYAKNPETIRTQYIMELAKRAEIFYAMSGTPVPNRPYEFWPILYSMGVIKMDPLNFGMRYCNGRQTAWGMDYSGQSNLAELRELIAPFVRRRTKAEVVSELPDKTFRVIPLELPDALVNEQDEVGQTEHRKTIKALEKEEFRRLDFSIPQEVLSTIMRMHGEAKMGPALEYILDLYEDGVEKLVIGAWHKDVIQFLLDGLAHAGKKVIHYSSAVSPAKRGAVVDAFQNDPSIVGIVGNIKSMGVGITLTAASHQVAVETNWSPADLFQWSDRCHRIGQDSAVTIDILTVHRSLDEHVLRRVLEKKGVTDRCLPGYAVPEWSGSSKAAEAVASAQTDFDEDNDLPF